MTHTIIFFWHERADNHKFDVRDYETIRPLFNDAEIVFHLAAEARIQPAINNPIEAVDINTRGTATVLQCAREAGVRCVVYSSTSSVYGNNPPAQRETDPVNCLNPYSVSKYAGEELCRVYSELYGLPTVSLRYFNVYGAREPLRGPYAPVIGLFERQFAYGEPLTIVGTGKQRRDFTHVDDVVDANIAAADRDWKKFYCINIGSGVSYSINEVAKMIGGETRTVPFRRGEAIATCADITRAAMLLDWEPRMDLTRYLLL